MLTISIKIHIFPSSSGQFSILKHHQNKGERVGGCGAGLELTWWWMVGGGVSQNRMWEIKQQRRKNQNLTVFRIVQPMVTDCWLGGHSRGLWTFGCWCINYRRSAAQDYYIRDQAWRGCVVIYMNKIISCKYSLYLISLHEELLSFFRISDFNFEFQEFAVLEQRTLMDDERFISSLK